MKKIATFLLTVFFTGFLAFVPVFALATDDPPEDDPPIQTTRDQALNQLRFGAGVNDVGDVPIDPRLIAAKVIQVFVSLLGIIMLILLVMAGYWFFTARGDEEKAKKGLDTIKRSVIGLVITLAAYGIVSFVIAGIERAVNN